MATFATAERNSRVLLLGDHRYRIHYRSGGCSYWRCANIREACRARVVLRGDAVREVVGAHNHVGHDVPERKRFVAELKQKVADDPTTPVKAIYDKHLAEKLASLMKRDSIPHYPSLHATLYRHRASVRKKAPNSVQQSAAEPEQKKEEGKDVDEINRILRRYGVNKNRCFRRSAKHSRKEVRPCHTVADMEQEKSQLPNHELQNNVEESPIEGHEDFQSRIQVQKKVTELCDREHESREPSTHNEKNYHQETTSSSTEHENIPPLNRKEESGHEERRDTIVGMSHAMKNARSHIENNISVLTPDNQYLHLIKENNSHGTQEGSSNSKNVPEVQDVLDYSKASVPKNNSSGTQEKSSNSKHVPEGNQVVLDYSKAPVPKTAHRGAFKENVIKNYICQVCEKRFLTNDVLKKHLNLQISMDAYRCNVCDDKVSYCYTSTEHEMFRSKQSKCHNRLASKATVEDPMKNINSTLISHRSHIPEENCNGFISESYKHGCNKMHSCPHCSRAQRELIAYRHSLEKEISENGFMKNYISRMCDKMCLEEFLKKNFLCNIRCSSHAYKEFENVAMQQSAVSSSSGGSRTTNNNDGRLKQRLPGDNPIHFPTVKPCDSGEIEIIFEHHSSRQNNVGREEITPQQN